MDDKPLTLASSDFELFAVPARFAQDAGALDARWKELQREAHPDRFAAQGVAAQRQAMQWSVRINEAYQRLKNPLKRAAYLCELAGAPVNAENNTAMPAQFLIEQMQWREALDDATDEADITGLLELVQQARIATLQQCEELLDVRHAPGEAVGQVRALMFIERFSQDVESRLDDFQNSPANVAGTSGQAS
jgi:molecular chaperone HscB